MCVDMHTHMRVHVWVWVCTCVSIRKCRGQRTIFGVVLHVPAILGFSDRLSHWDLGLTNQPRLAGQHLGV